MLEVAVVKDQLWVDLLKVMVGKVSKGTGKTVVVSDLWFGSPISSSQLSAVNNDQLGS